MSGFRPVVLIHGLGSSFEQDWERPGWSDALVEQHRLVVPFGLPGHSSPPPESGQEDEVVQRVLRVAEEWGPVDAVGFSVGALLLLTAAVRRPESFGRVALLGLGDVQLQARPNALTFEKESPVLRGVRRSARRADHVFNDVLTFAVRQFQPPAFEELPRLGKPVLLVLGDRDPVAPATQILAALPDARLVMVPGMDHGATPGHLVCQAAVLDFLAE